MKCSTCYSLPTPLWGTLLFIVLGLLLTGAGAFAVLVVLTHSGSTVPILINGLLTFLGLSTLGFAFRSFQQKECVAPEFDPSAKPQPVQKPDFTDDL